MTDTAARRAAAIDPADWLAEILARVPVLDMRTLPIADAVGRTLAAPVYPAHALPIWENSAMDGYAVRHEDLANLASGEEVTLTLVAEIPAGSPLDPPLAPGHTARIMTGAPIPTDADTVVPVELTRSDTPGHEWARHAVTVTRHVERGANVRRAAEDIGHSDLLADAGVLLTPARASALAAAGTAHVQVRRQPRVAVVITGSELVSPDAELVRGQIPESNSVLISGLVTEAGLSTPEVVRSVDDAAELSSLLEQLSMNHDVIITTGGVGPGTHDVVRIALEAEPEVRAVRVAIRPGQPQSAGRLQSGAFIFALPGNPVSAAVSFECFVRPALLMMQGREEVQRLRVPAVATQGWEGKPGRLQVLPVSIAVDDGVLTCRPSVNPRGVSHAVGRHGGTDGYALVEPERAGVRPGEVVSVMVVRQ